MRYFCSFLLLLAVQGLQAQFDPAAEQEGSKALHKDSSVFIAWANSCEVERGLEDAADSLGVKASYGVASDAVGKSDGSVVSLGDGGYAILTFEVPVANGEGADFAIFENAFSDTYLELAFVEVSSDGERFVRFPAISNTDTTQQVGSFGQVDATKIHNLAGKYRAFWGTPFDLEDLKDSAGLDINRITHIKIIDVIGSLNDSFCTRDSRGFKVNDPYPTAFESGGFDLDAVGVIHNATNVSSRPVAVKQIILSPNPASMGVPLVLSLKEPFTYIIYGVSGKVVCSSNGFLTNHTLVMEQQGVYFVQWKTENGESGTAKWIVR